MNSRFSFKFFVVSLLLTTFFSYNVTAKNIDEIALEIIYESAWINDLISRHKLLVDEYNYNVVLSSPFGFSSTIRKNQNSNLSANATISYQIYDGGRGKKNLDNISISIEESKIRIIIDARSYLENVFNTLFQYQNLIHNIKVIDRSIEFYNEIGLEMIDLIYQKEWLLLQKEQLEFYLKDVNLDYWNELDFEELNSELYSEQYILEEVDLIYRLNELSNKRNQINSNTNSNNVNIELKYNIGYDQNHNFDHQLMVSGSFNFNITPYVTIQSNIDIAQPSTSAMARVQKMTYIPSELYFSEAKLNHDQFKHQISLFRGEHSLRVKEADVWKKRAEMSNTMLYPLTPDSINEWSRTNINYVNFEIKCNNLQVKLLILQGYFDQLIESVVEKNLVII